MIIKDILNDYSSMVRGKMFVIEYGLTDNEFHDEEIIPYEGLTVSFWFTVRDEVHFFCDCSEFLKIKFSNFKNSKTVGGVLDELKDFINENTEIEILESPHRVFMNNSIDKIRQLSALKICDFTLWKIDNALSITLDSSEVVNLYNQSLKEGWIR